LNKQKLIEIRQKDMEAKRARYLKLRPEVAHTKYGFDVFLNPDDAFCSFSLYEFGYYTETSTTNLFLKLIASKSGLIVDVGANIGWYTLLAAKKGAKQVHAFEPVPQIIELLEKSVKKNGFSEQIVAHKSVVSDHIGKTTLFLNPHINRGLASTVRNTGNESVICDAVTLDSLFEDRVVDLLKLDVEGAEPNVLVGAKKMIEEKRLCHVLMEWNQESWKDKMNLLEPFKIEPILPVDSSPPNVHLSLK
jgi:FkbM family methyltransferase